MIVLKKVLGHTDDIELENEYRDYIDLEWQQLNKKRLRTRTVQGREVAIILKDDVNLSSGDILFSSDDLEVVVRARKEPALVIYPETPLEMGKACYQLGNRHLPCLITEEEIIVRYDNTLVPVLEEVGVRYEKTERRFTRPFKYAGHHHE
jgi:urease accessory protein